MKKIYAFLMAMIFAVSSEAVWSEEVIEVTTPEGLASAVQTVANAGKTIKLMNDITVGNVGMTVSNITLDLNGFTFSNSSGDFMHVANDIGGLKFKNGTFYTPGSVIVMQNSGAGNMVFEDCVFTGLCFIYGSYGSVTLKNCVSTCSYFVSPACGNNLYLYVEDSVVNASIEGVGDGCQAHAYLRAGYYSFDPTSRLDPAYYAVTESGSINGVAYNYKVLAYPAVAEVIPTTGDSVRYTVFASALDAVRNDAGATLKLLNDVTINYSYDVSSTDLTIDLNGFSLSNNTCDFLVVNSGKLTFANGTLSSSASVFILHGGTINVNDCVIRGLCMLYGDGGALNFNSGKVESELFVSKNCGSGVALNFNGGIATPTYKVTDHDDETTTNAKVTLNGGRFSFYMPSWAADGKTVVYENAIVDGSDCYWTVIDSSNKKDGHFMVNGIEYSALGDAINAAEPNDTITFLGDFNYGDGPFRPNKNLVFDLNGYCFSNGMADFIYPEADVHLVWKNGTLLKSKSVTQSLFMVNNSVNVVIDVMNCALQGYCLVYGFGTLNLDDQCYGNLFCMGSRNGSATLNVAGGRYNFGQWRDVIDDNGTSYHIKGGYWTLDPTEFLVKPDSCTVIDNGANYRTSGLRSRYYVKLANGMVIIIR